MSKFKSITGIEEPQETAVGDSRMRPWNVLAEIEIQGVKIQGTIVARVSSQENAEDMAKIQFVNAMRRIGAWATTKKVEESFEVETDKKDDKGKPIIKTETRSITKYLAPDKSNVTIIKILPMNDRDLTYSDEELDYSSKVRNMESSTTTKRRTSGQKALAERKKKQKQLEKKEEAQLAKETKRKSSIDKEELFQKVIAYFDKPKKVKDASNDLQVQYQKVRYALFFLKDKGFNGQIFELKESEIDGNKAFQLIVKK